MTLQEILNEIDERYPNTISTATKIGWLNLTLKQVFKYAPKENTYTLLTVEDQALYDLPEYIKVERIKPPLLITIEDYVLTSESRFRKHYYAGAMETLESEWANRLNGYKYYSASYNNENKIGIYPVPEETGLIIKFMYDKYPVTLSADDLTASPDILEEHHELLVYECIIKCAMSGNNPDIDVANAFIPIRNSHLKDIMDEKYEYEPYYPVTKDAMKRGNLSRRMLSSSRRKHEDWSPYN